MEWRTRKDCNSAQCNAVWGSTTFLFIFYFCLSFSIILPSLIFSFSRILKPIALIRITGTLYILYEMNSYTKMVQGANRPRIFGSRQTTFGNRFLFFKRAYLLQSFSNFDIDCTGQMKCTDATIKTTLREKTKQNNKKEKDGARRVGVNRNEKRVR